MALLRTAQLKIAARKLGKYVTPCSVQQLLLMCERRAYTSDAKPAPRQIDPLDLRFNDPVASFKSKTMIELVRAYIVYQICSINYIVENNMRVTTTFY